MIFTNICLLKHPKMYQFPNKKKKTRIEKFYGDDRKILPRKFTTEHHVG